MYLNQTAGSDGGIYQGDGHKLATMGWEEVGESGFEGFWGWPYKESASHNWGAQSVWLLITDGFPAFENQGAADIRCVEEADERKACHYHHRNNVRIWLSCIFA